MGMRFSWAKVALGAVIGAAFAAPVASAVAQQPPELVRITIHLKDADLLAATQVLMQKAGLQMVVEPSDKPFGRITLDLTDMPAEDVVRYMCQAAGAYFRRDENGVYILSHKKPEEARINDTAEPKAAKPK